MNNSPGIEAVAELRNASVRYADVQALAPTTLRFPAARSVALVGANGSGKSTLLKLVAGLLEPSSGEVWRARDLDISFVAQQHGHHRWMPLSVDEVLRMGCYRGQPLIRRLRRDQVAELDAVAERLEVADLRRRAFGDLSGGQRQRVLVAQSLIGSPRLLLLDEPITGLDLASQQTILSVIDDEVAAGSAVVFSTHHLDEARHARRVILLAGEVIADGEPDDVLRPELLAAAFGGRVLRIADATLLVDDHGHGVEDG